MKAASWGQLGHTVGQVSLGPGRWHNGSGRPDESWGGLGKHLLQLRGTLHQLPTFQKTSEIFPTFKNYAGDTN